MPRILDKEQAIASARLGLLAVRAVRPGALLVRADAHARLAARGPVAVRRAAARPEPLRARLVLLGAVHWTREERLMQLFTLARR